MTLIRWNPWTDLTSLQDQMDQLMTQVFGSDVRWPESGTSLMTLPVDVRQSETEFIVEASIPGFKPEDVEITVDNGTLTIQGEMHEEKEEKKGEYVRRERRRGSFARTLQLPSEVREDDVKATFENGILTVELPRQEKAHPKRVPVTVNGKVITSGAAKKSS